VTPHCLRKAFERAVRNSGLDGKDQEFLIGHVLPGNQDTYYDKTSVEELRKKYAKVEFFPHRKTFNEELRKKQVLDMVNILGFSDDKIKKVEEALAKYENVDDALDEIKKLSLNSHAYAKQNKSIDQGKARVRIVRGEQRLIGLLSEDWDLVKELSHNRFLLRKRTPSTMRTRIGFHILTEKRIQDLELVYFT
jgi:hypothetical protein